MAKLAGKYPSATSMPALPVILRRGRPVRHLLAGAGTNIDTLLQLLWPPASLCLTRLTMRQLLGRAAAANPNPRRLPL